MKVSVFAFLIGAAPVTADVAIITSFGPFQASVNPAIPPALVSDLSDAALTASEILGSQHASPVDIALQLGLAGCDALGPAQEGLPITRPESGYDNPASAMNTTPASPSGLMMALSGLLTLGGWQLTRSARNMHFQSPPDWYHPGGPSQIGHTVACDLELTLLPACCFEIPATGPSLVPSLWLVTISFHGTSQNALTPAAPRGPPHLS